MLRPVISLLALAGGLALVGLVAAGLLLARLAQGPLDIESLAPSIVGVLDQRFGGAYQFSLARASIIRNESGIMLALQDMAVRDAGGHDIVAAPAALLQVDPFALMMGKIVPHRLEILDVNLRLLVQPDGGIAISAGIAGAEPIVLSGAMPERAQELDAADAPSSSTPPPPAPLQSGTERIVGLLRALVDAATRDDSPLGALDRLSIRRGRLSIDDRILRHVVEFQGVDLTLDKNAGLARMQLAADGQGGRWSAILRASAGEDGGRGLDAEIKDVSFDDIAPLAGLNAQGFILDTPMSARLKIAFDARGQVAAAGGRFVIGAGLLKLDHPDFEPVMMDEISGDLRMDPGSGGIVVENMVIDAGATHFEAAGTVDPPRDGAAGWHFAFATRAGGSFGPERPGEKPIVLDEIALAGQVLPGQQKLDIDSFRLQGTDLHFGMSGALQWGASAKLSLAAESHDSNLRESIRLWPSFVAAPARAWALQHATAGRIGSGRLALDFDAPILDLLAHERPIPDEALHLSASISDAALLLLPGMPAVSGLEGTLTVSGRKVNAQMSRGLVDAGAGHLMLLSEGSFTVPDTGPKIFPASVAVHLAGSLDTVTQLLATEGLKRYASLPLDANVIKGQVEGRLAIDLKLGKPAVPEDTQVRVNATITNFVAEKLIGKEKLEAGTLTVLADRQGFRAFGQGRMFGAVASLDLKKQGADNAEATIGVMLDDAARAKQGLAIQGLSGPVSARIVSALSGDARSVNANVEIDLAQATIDGALPGLFKAAGRPAKATFQLVGDSAGTILEQIAFDGGGASLRGSAKFGGDGGFISAKINQLHLSPTDDMRVDVTKAGEGVKIVMRGNLFDARPLIQGLINPPAASGREAGRDVDVDFKSAKVTGNKGQILSGVDAKFSKKGGQIRQFQLSGRFGAAQLTGSLSAQGQVNVQCDNAGAFLSFADLYRRMEGGVMSLSLQEGGGRFEGNVLIHDFLLRDEPALRRLASEGTKVRDDQAGTRFDTTAIEFSKLQASFTKTGGRIELRDGIMYGPQIGTSLEGVVDFSKNFIDMKGTFVPAYGLNNFFARIPVLGVLLGGGAHEGLFAVNFRISGPASGPTLNINPLSALAPGFLRKIFGAGEIPSAFQTPGAAK